MPRDRAQVLELIETEMRSNNWDPHVITTILQYLERLRTGEHDTFQVLRQLTVEYLKND